MRIPIAKMLRTILVATICLLPLGKVQAVGYDVVGVYWSGYFTGTIVGEYHSYCDFSYESWGTLDGETLEVDKTNCSTGQQAVLCYAKIDGQWQPVSCP